MIGEKMKKNKKKYWYKFYIGECPFCGRDRSFKERKYTKKPKNLKNRIEYLSDTFTFCCQSKFC